MWKWHFAKNSENAWAVNYGLRLPGQELPSSDRVREWNTGTGLGGLVSAGVVGSNPTRSKHLSCFAGTSGCYRHQAWWTYQIDDGLSDGRTFCVFRGLWVQIPPELFCYFSGTFGWHTAIQACWTYQIDDGLSVNMHICAKVCGFKSHQTPTFSLLIGYYP